MDFYVNIIGHTKKYALEHIIKSVFIGANLFFTEGAKNVVESRLEGNTVYTKIIFSNDLEIEKLTDFPLNQKSCRTFNGEYSIDLNNRLVYDIGSVVKLSFINAVKQFKNPDIPWGILTGVRPSKVSSMLFKKGYSETEIRDMLKNEALLTDSKTELAMISSFAEINALKKMDKHGASLYIGIPFCPSRCSYCSFISRDIGRNHKMINDYLTCLHLEIEAASKIFKEKNYVLESIYIGGGTPTVLDDDKLTELLSKIANCFDLRRLKEYSVEAGRPDTINDEKLSILRSFGVDRISVNPQTLQDKTLRAIGRKHTASDFLDAFKKAEKYNFKSINVDLILGLPNESLDDFKDSFLRVMALNPSNITLHALSLKRSSDLYEINRLTKETIFSENGDISIINNNSQRCKGELLYSDQAENKIEKNVAKLMADFAYATLGKSGYSPYYMYRQKNIIDNLENIGYARFGMESVYNIYMMQEMQSIIALGGGAVSKKKDDNSGEIFRFRNPKYPEEYIKSIEDIITKKLDFYIK